MTAAAVSNHDPLDLIEADLIAPAIVELRRVRRGMVRRVDARARALHWVHRPRAPAPTPEIETSLRAANLMLKRYGDKALEESAAHA